MFKNNHLLYLKGDMIMESSAIRKTYDIYSKLISEKKFDLSKRSTGTLSTKENMSYFFSLYILEDCNTIINLIDNKCNERYIYSIIRIICESIIQYKYFMQNKHLIGQYFGSELPDVDEDDVKEVDLDSYKELGQKRFKCFKGKINIKKCRK